MVQFQLANSKGRYLPRSKQHSPFIGKSQIGIQRVREMRSKD